MFAKKVQSCKFKDVKFVDGELIFQNEYDLSIKVLNNHNLYTRAVFVIAYSLFLASNPSLIFANPCAWIESMGNGAINAIQVTGIKILTAGLILELVREGMRGGSHNASSILTRYALLISGVIFAPQFVEILESFVKSYRP